MKKWVETNNNYLSFNQTNQIRGICALIILLHHIFAYMNGNRFVWFFFENIGTSMVAIFFFYSGYGLLYSEQNKKNYLHGFIKNKVMKIIFPYIFVNIYMLLFDFIVGNTVDLHTLKKSVQYGYPIVLYSWYIIELLLLYIFFYISFKFFKKCSLVIKHFILFFLMMCMVTFFATIHYGEWWYTTCAGFIYGAFYFLHQKGITSFFKRFSLLNIVMMILGFGIFHVLAQHVHFWLLVFLLKSLRLICFVNICLIISLHISLKSVILNYIGRFSLEIYLIQGLTISAIYKLHVTKNAYLFALIITFVTLLVAAVQNRVDRKIKFV